MPGLVLKAPVGSSTSWQLLTGHYIQAKAAPTIIHPRPDAETSSWARCRLAPDGIPYRLPVVVNHGAWPFEYYLTSAPSGMTIGQHYGDTDYGVITWASPVIGSYTVSVRVRTQDYTRTGGSADSTGELTVDFTLSVVDKTDVSKFLFLDSVNGNDSNTGSYSSPRASLVGFNSLTSANKQLFLRQGTYSNQSLSGDLNLTNGTKACVVVGYPGETATIDFTGSNIRNLALTGPDGYVGNVKTYGGTSTSGDIYHWNAFGNRMTMFECISDNLFDSPGTGSFTNHSGWSMFANPSEHRYVALINNTFSNYSLITNGGGSIWYSVRDGVFEGNTISGMNIGGSTEGFRTKGYCRDITIRNNYVPSGQTFGQSALSQYQGHDGGSGVSTANNEMCWNLAYGPNDRDTGALAFGRNTAEAWTGWMYRNTAVGAVVIGSNGFTCSMIEDNNVYLNFSGTANDQYSANIVGLTVTSNNNVLDVYANRASVVDAQGKLLSAYLTSNGLTRGTRGHEVA